MLEGSDTTQPSVLCARGGQLCISTLLYARQREAELGQYIHLQHSPPSALIGAKFQPYVNNTRRINFAHLRRKLHTPSDGGSGERRRRGLCMSALDLLIWSGKENLRTT